MPKAYELFAPAAQGMAEELKRRRELENKRQELIEEERRKLEELRRRAMVDFPDLFSGGRFNIEKARETPGISYKEGKVEYETPKYLGEQPIVDEKGQVIGYRPRGAVFQPRESSTEAILQLLGKEQGVSTETLPGNQENLISQYMKKYPGRTREQIINAMRRQGLL